VIRQTWAIFVDAYRELNAKKLFWFVLGLSALFVSAIACVGINERGVSVLWWNIEAPMFNSKIITKSLFYRYWFFGVGFKVWLTWAATILALVSTAGIFPDFISGGTIELSLSKPIGRLRLFLTKYFSGLLFVTLQVAIFATGAFLVLRMRGESWVPAIFLSIPLVLAFFSYLYAFCVLIGMLTRSTIASLLLTILVWLLIFLVHLSETGIVLSLKVRSDQSVAIREVDLQKREADLGLLKAREAPTDPAEAKKLSDSIATAEKTIQTRRPKLEAAKKTQQNLTTLHAILYATKTFMPKTSETMALLGRALLSEEELSRMEPPGGGNDFEFGDTERDLRVNARSVQREVERLQRKRSVAWVLGTSLLFEVGILGIAAWIFCKRDF